jgi:hypothetical protein
MQARLLLAWVVFALGLVGHIFIFAVQEGRPAAAGMAGTTSYRENAKPRATVSMIVSRPRVPALRASEEALVGFPSFERQIQPILFCGHLVHLLL